MDWLATALEQSERENSRMRFEASPHQSAPCTAVSSAPVEPVEALGRIAAISGELGAEGIAIEANELAERVSEGRFYVACVGQFKRGKSTLLNALKMPKIDGLEVLRHVKTDPELRTIPVVVLTSSREEQDLVHSYNLGVNAYVVKPVDFHAFVDAMSLLGGFWAVLNEPFPAR